MKVFVAILSLVTFVVANVEEDIYKTYAGADQMMDINEMGKYWMHFDENGDNNVTKGEFDHVWKRDDLGDKDRAPFFFLELDRVPDEVLNDLDIPHIFRLFDEDGDSIVTRSEFKFNWNGLFND